MKNNMTPGQRTLIVLILLIVVPAVLFLFMKFVSVLIPDIIAKTVLITGAAIYSLAWSATKFSTKKKYGSQNEIILDNPKIYDLSRIIGSMLCLIGLVTWSAFFSFVRGEWNEGGFSMFYAVLIGGIVPLGIVLFMTVNILELRNSLNDKIYISKSRLILPLSVSDDEHIIEKNDFKELVYLQNWTQSHGQYYNDNYKLIFHLNSGEEIVYNPTHLNISFDEFVNALAEREWEHTKKYFHEGTEEGADGWITETEATL